MERTGTSRSVPRQICTLAGTAALTLAASAASAQMTCACDNLIPPGYQIADCRQNEDGGSPQHVVGFGATTTMRHANFFQPGITITHVCVNLVQTVTHAEVQFRDDASGQPGGIFHAETFAISPNGNGFQLIQLNTAQTPSTSFWLTIEYPNAPGGQGAEHQGTRQRIASASAVEPVGYGWFDYDDTATTGYVNMAPIIRGLQLTSSNCPTCPAGANQVCDPCGTAFGTCDGCVAGNFEIAECGEVYCGELEVTSVSVEKHWFELHVPSTTTGTADIGLIIESDLPIDLELHDSSCSHPVPNILASTSVAACSSGTLGATVPAPGTYHIRVAPQAGLLPRPCGTDNSYVMEVHYWDPLTGAHCPSSTGSCPAATNDCFVTSSAPGCNDPVCCDAVCACDPFCCNNMWDAICVGLPFPGGCGAVNLPDCVGCGDPGNNCCATGVGPHCDDAECCVEVCALDPTCCEIEWHAGCASLAQQHCATCSQGPPLNNDCSGAGPTAMGWTVFDFGGTTASNPPEPACGIGGAGSPDHDKWFFFTSPCTQGGPRSFTFHLDPDPASPTLQRRLALYSACPSAGGVLLGCDTGVGGMPAIVDTTLIPGETVFIRATAPFGDAAHLTGLAIGYTTTCVGDLNDDCIVDILDVFECLNTWGLPGGCDLNQLFDILANWGPCP